MKTAIGTTVFAAASLTAFACVIADGTPVKMGPPLTADKPFAAGGRVQIQLASGGYVVRAAADNHVRITSDQNIGDASVDVTTDGESARVESKDTPRNFRATIEVPARADLVVHLTAGELVIEPIAGNKDINSNAGEIRVAVGNPDDYATVDATLKAGDIQADAFGGSRSGVMPHFTWSGPGKRTLHADLGAGKLVLQR
jgi:hypothetical protein